MYEMEQTVFDQFLSKNDRKSRFIFRVEVGMANKLFAVHILLTDLRRHERHSIMHKVFKLNFKCNKHGSQLNCETLTINK